MTTEVNDEAIAAASESVDKESATTNVTSEEPKTVKGMLAAMNKHSDGTNVMKESIKTFSNPFGSDKKNDVFVSTKEEAATKLKAMIAEDRGNRKASSKKFKRWDFRSSPHEQFEKTLDDTYAAFVQWAIKSDEETDETSFNVSKAYRRIEQYADWMEDTGEELTAEPLTAASVRAGLKAWAMRSTIDKNDNFVWWIDFKQVDKVAVKTTLSTTDSLRCFVWYAHYVMYNEIAQKNGLVFVEAVGKFGFIECMTFVPMKLGVKLDRLTVGILPIKMNACYILDSAAWMDIIGALMGMFMSKKIKGRVRVLKEWSELEEITGKECIPKPFGELEGTVEVDLVDAKYNL